MMNDERVMADVKVAKSVSYIIFWFGIFAVLLYRWFVLHQTLMDTLDFFLVWLSASLAQFFILAAKGIPITYPVTLKRKGQQFYVFLVPLLTGVLTSLLVFIRVGLDLRRMLGGFAGSFLATLFLFVAYWLIVQAWEKKYVEGND
ncbi:hypothetical protein [Anoxynatronum buryatiense]|uniref:Uncharacterized protein n=1 Tax=Anoxynatronum buryatiense TaxID=489973 RepID=A0AA45WZ61_9CLOT|nr:hypothetical protein [Anoxynatronum buryatiense]SMP71676.1 hypothetical protein SAMN06296020_12416 [Anoxynatronum buryatiense]